MKRFKKITAALILLVTLGIETVATEVCPNAVRNAIWKYQHKDYVGCIQDLEDYSKEDPSNAIAYYYTGIAYMNIGLKDKAIDAFDKVSTINSVPILSSYAIQASNCMKSNINPCVYKKYTESEIEQLVADPAGFFAKKEENPDQEVTPIASPEEITDIDRLIKGEYPDNIHPDANKVIQETRLIQEQERVNSELRQKIRTQQNTNKPAGETSEKPKTKSDASKNDKNNKLAVENLSDKEIADAVRTLSKAGYKFTSPAEVANNNNINPYKQMAAQYALNDDAAQMALMFGNNNNNNNSFDAMLPYLLMQEKNADGTSKQIDPELIKTMMMSRMMGDFDLGFDNNKNK